MICQRPGCTNEVGYSKYRPRKYCHTRECEKALGIEIARRRAKKERKVTQYPSFICAACGEIIQQKDFKPRKYCSNEECQHKRVNRNAEDARRRNPNIKKRIPKEKPSFSETIQNFQNDLAVAVPERLLLPCSEENILVQKSRILFTPEQQAERSVSMDRGSKSGFERYMKENPIYFQYAFPRMTIEDAWKDLKSVFERRI
jgi:hypothetical protein